MVRAGTRRPLVGVVAGILGPAVLANGMAYRFPRLGGRTTPAGCGVPAAGHLIIPLQIGEARTEAGVIRSRSEAAFGGTQTRPKSLRNGRKSLENGDRHDPRSGQARWPRAARRGIQGQLQRAGFEAGRLQQSNQLMVFPRRGQTPVNTVSNKVLPVPIRQCDVSLQQKRNRVGIPTIHGGTRTFRTLF